MIFCQMTLHRLISLLNTWADAILCELTFLSKCVCVHVCVREPTPF